MGEGKEWKLIKELVDSGVNFIDTRQEKEKSLTTSVARPFVGPVWVQIALDVVRNHH